MSTLFQLEDNFQPLSIKTAKDAKKKVTTEPTIKVKGKKGKKSKKKV
jgi:hypothetical protein